MYLVSRLGMEVTHIHLYLPSVLGQQKPVWYLMENYGLALTHSDHPNFICRPFADAVTGRVMSLVWPVEEVLPGDVCTRNFVPPLFFGETLEQRSARRDAILSFASNWYIIIILAPTLRPQLCSFIPRMA